MPTRGDECVSPSDSRIHIRIRGCLHHDDYAYLHNLLQSFMWHLSMLSMFGICTDHDEACRECAWVFRMGHELQCCANGIGSNNDSYSVFLPVQATSVGLFAFAPYRAC